MSLGLSLCQASAGEKRTGARHVASRSRLACVVAFAPMKGFHPGCYGSGMADRWAQLVLGRKSQGPALLEVISQGHREPFIRGVREASHPVRHEDLG